MTRQFFSSVVVATLALTACGISVSQSDSADVAAESSVTEAPEVAAPTDAVATTEPLTATTEAAPVTTEVAPATTEPLAATTEAAPTTTEAPVATTETVAASGHMNINTDGPTVCIDAALAVLGPDAMINEISSSFEPGDDIDPPLIEDDDPPVPGDLYFCEAYYQDPDDPIKLLGIEMDTDTGEFSEPAPVEIDYFGDPAEFDLNDYVIKASEVNPTPIQPKMDEKAPALDEIYSIWRWRRVDLEPPGPFNDVHVFDLGMTGRLATNDLVDSDYITLGMDGTVIYDSLAE